MSLKEALPLNYELLGNPVNWVILLLMIALAGAAMAVIIPAAPDVLDATL